MGKLQQVAVRRLVLTLALGASLTALACGGSDDSGDDANSGGDALSAGSTSTTKSFVAKGTGYFPSNSGTEGGFVDRKGVKLGTLQQYLSGQAKYVSVSMDTKAFGYGQRLRIHELNTKYDKDIVFRVVDTGGAFTGKGTTRIDICTADAKAAGDPTINGQLHIDAIADNAPSQVPDAGSGSTSDSGATAYGDDDDSTPSGSGASCSSDGTCNPGNDGSGLICVSSRCVPGCHSDAQCPGATSCQSGQCR